MVCSCKPDNPCTFVSSPLVERVMGAGARLMTIQLNSDITSAAAFAAALLASARDPPGSAGVAVEV